MPYFWNDPSNLAPKQAHRWVIHFGDDSAFFYAKSVDRPSYNLNTVKGKLLYSHTVNFPGRLTWNPIKVTLYEKICQQSLLLGKLEMSAQHLELSKAIREREGWKVKDTLQQLQAKINQEITNQQSTFTKFEGDITKLNQICRKFWKEILYQDIPRYCGTIES